MHQEKRLSLELREYLKRSTRKPKSTPKPLCGS